MGLVRQLKDYLPMTRSGKIVCGACECVPEGPSDPNPGDRIFCPRCNRADKFEDVLKSVADYIADNEKQALSGLVAEVVRGNKHIHLSNQRSAKLSHRWIVRFPS